MTRDDAANNGFTPAAAVQWRKIPDWAQAKLLANVWCSSCRSRPLSPISAAKW